jgi:hypothetical protein
MIHRIFLLCLLFFAANVGAMQKYTDFVADKYGNVRPGVAVLVKDSNGAPATLYSDNGITPKANPTTTDANGIFSFYAANGTYTVKIPGASDKTALLFDPQDSTSSSYMRFTSSSTGAITRTLQSKLLDFRSILDWAKCDNITNDTTAVQTAFNSGYPIFVPGGANCLINPGITLPNGLIVVGGASGTGTGSDYANFPAARFIFTGAGAAGFISANTAAFLNQGAFKNITVTTASGSQVTWLFDLRGPISWDFDDDRFENTYASGGGLRSRAIDSDPTTWLNRISNTEIRVPDASTLSPLDIDWSDSFIVSSIFTGGIGSFYRGPGNISFTADEFDRSSAVGLTLSKELTSNGQISIVGSFFDSNVGGGIKITAASSPGGTLYGPTITGNGFRDVAATYEIIFDSTGIGTLMTGPTIANNSMQQSSVLPYSIDESKWQVAFIGNSIANTAWQANVWGDTRAQTAVVGRYGINIAGGTIIGRNSQTLRGAPNVAAGFGVNTDASPLLVVGTKDGTTPYVGASADNASANADLGLLAGAAIRLRLTSNGGQFRPEADIATSLGASTLNWSNLFTKAVTLRTGSGGNPWALTLDGSSNLNIGYNGTTTFGIDHLTSAFGYLTGAGGTATQATDKSTSVEVDRPSMQITMNNASLASGAKASFSVTNSAVTATDVPVCAVASGGTANAYRAAVTAIGSGTFTVTVENITGGSLAESPVINCNVIKGASS